MNVVGVDLSTRAIDLVKLAEDSNRAEWVRCDLAGTTAWERTLDIREALWRATGDSFYRWLEGVYLVAVEQPVNDQKRVLRLVEGAIVSSLPARLRQPHCCWEVHPSTWKAGLGLKGKPTKKDLERIAGTSHPFTGSEYREPTNQNARDAYCLAMFARDSNARAVEKALGAA